MSYFFSKTINKDFDETIERVKEVLQENGFGVLTEIDIKGTLKKKLDVEFNRYRILGACHPPSAHKALQAENKIGLMLPCNMIVQEVGDGQVEVAAIDPIASMQAVDNNQLGAVAQEVQRLLQAVVEQV